MKNHEQRRGMAHALRAALHAHCLPPRPRRVSRLSLPSSLFTPHCSFMACKSARRGSAGAALKQTGRARVALE